MPETVFTLTAESGEAVAGVLKLVEAQQKAIEASKKMKESAKETKDSFGEIGDLAQELGNKMSGGMLSSLQACATPAGALKLAFETIEASIERSVERAEKFKNQIESLVAAAARAGAVDMLPELQKQIKSIKSDTVSKEDIENESVALLNQFGTRLTMNQLVEATKFATHAKEKHLDAQAAGSIYGTMEELFSGSSAKDREHLTGLVLNSGGAFSEKETRNMRRDQNLGLEKAVENVLLLRRSGEASRAIDKIDALAENLTPESLHTPQAKLSPEAQRQVEAIDKQIHAIDHKKAELESKVTYDAQGHKRYDAIFPNVTGVRQQERLYEEEQNKLHRQQEALNLKRKDIEDTKSVSAEEQTKYNKLLEIAQIPNVEDRKAELLKHPELMPGLAKPARNLEQAKQELIDKPFVDVFNQDLNPANELPGAHEAHKKQIEETKTKNREWDKMHNPQNIYDQTQVEKFKNKLPDFVPDSVKSFLSYLAPNPVNPNAIPPELLVDPQRDKSPKEEPKHVVIVGDKSTPSFKPARNGSNE